MTTHIDTNDNSNAFNRNVLEVTSQLRQIYENQTLTQADVIMVMGKAMELVEQRGRLSGPEKKRIVMESVQHFLSHHGDNSGWDTILDTIIPMVIDQLISASKGGLKINKKAFRSCLNMLKCC